MKIVKEDIDNLERYIGNSKVGVHAELPLIMADAYEESKKKKEEIDKEMEEKTKDNVKLNKVIGAKKQPVPELPKQLKANLEESLFEDYDSGVRYYSDMLFDMIEDGIVDAEYIAKDLIYWCSEDDIEHYMRVNDLLSDDEDDDIDESLNEDYTTDLVSEILSGQVKKPSYKNFKYLSNNGTVGEVEYMGNKYAFRKRNDGSYKVMRSSDAGWNWSETLYKESLKEARGPKKKPLVDKQGNSYGDEDRSEGQDELDNDIYNLVLDELSVADSSLYRRTRIPEIPQWNRYNHLDVGLDSDLNIVIHQPNESDFELAKRVADVYGLETRGPIKSGKYFKMTLVMPQE